MINACAAVTLTLHPPPPPPEQASFNRMAAQISASASVRHLGDQTQKTASGVSVSARSRAAADGLSGLRGEDRFLVVDSVAAPGESPVQSRFPFSFYVYRLLEDDVRTGTDMRATAAGAGTEETLQRKFALLRLGDRVHRTLSRAMFDGGNEESIYGVSHTAHGKSGGDDHHQDEDFLQRYVHDFTCMMLPSVRHMWRVDQARYVLMLLDLVGPGGSDGGGRSEHQEEERQESTELKAGEEKTRMAVWTPTTSIAGVHHRFWRAEHAIRLHVKLLDAAGPATLSAAVDVVKGILRKVAGASRKGYFSSGTCRLDAGVHISMARAVQLALLDANSMTQRSSAEVDDELIVEENATMWAAEVDAADRATKNIVAFCESSSGVGGDPSGNGSGSIGDENGQRVLAELREGWGKLRLMRRYVVDVVAPLSVPPRAALETLTTLRSVTGSLRSKKFLRAVVEALSWVPLHVQFAAPADGVVMNRSRGSSPGDGTGVTFRSNPWDVLPRFLEHYLLEVVMVTGKPTPGVNCTIEARTDTASAPRADSQDTKDDKEEEEQDEHGWAPVVAVLAADADYFMKGLSCPLSADVEDISSLLGWVFPSDTACVRGLRWLRRTEGVGADAGKALRAGLLASARKAGRSLENRLAACFVAAVEDDTTIAEVFNCVYFCLCCYMLLSLLPGVDYCCGRSFPMSVRSVADPAWSSILGSVV